MRATDLKTCMQRHCGKAHDGGYIVVPLHVQLETGVAMDDGWSLNQRNVITSFQSKLVLDQTVDVRSLFRQGEAASRWMWLLKLWLGPKMTLHVAKIVKKRQFWPLAEMSKSNGLLTKEFLAWKDGVGPGRELDGVRWWLVGWSGERRGKVFGREGEPWWGKIDGREKREERKEKRKMNYSGENLEFIVRRDFL